MERLLFRALAQNKHLLYWLIPLVLVVLQGIMTFNSLGQIRFEELIESVQAPLWFNQRQVLAGTHTNIGWYALLVAFYNIFGFSLFSAKFLLFFIYGLFVFSLAVLLRRLFEPVVALVVLITIALSPTVLFFNTQALHLGVGMQMVPVFILLLLSLNFAKRVSFLLEAVTFFLMMWVLLIYPPFMFFIPSIWLFWFSKFHPRGVHSATPGVLAPALHLTISLFAFLLPLILGFLYVQNREILILDSNTGTGIFRGGGRIELSETVFSQGMGGIVRDLFIQAGSYHFEVYKVDFSDVYPVITVITIIIFITFIYQREKKSRFLINLILLTIGFNLLVISATSDFGIPGMKRATPILASIYFLWVVCWYYLSNWSNLSNWTNLAAKGGLAVLLLHHLLVYPINLAHIADPSSFRDQSFFAVKETPQQSLDFFLDTLKKEDLVLDCRVFLTQFTNCDYEFITSALKGSCLWGVPDGTPLSCHEIKIYDN